MIIAQLSDSVYIELEFPYPQMKLHLERLGRRYKLLSCSGRCIEFKVMPGVTQTLTFTEGHGILRVLSPLELLARQAEV